MDPGFISRIKKYFGCSTDCLDRQLDKVKLFKNLKFQKYTKHIVIKSDGVNEVIELAI